MRNLTQQLRHVLNKLHDTTINVALSKSDYEKRMATYYFVSSMLCEWRLTPSHAKAEKFARVFIADIEDDYQRGLVQHLVLDMWQ